ncbi:hypothetical protein Tco_0922953 [Tanacetum coccineum]|uniref:Xylulose kinase-1 n=1 Tax=Tanacetum coccineum TaxID=301880 RepID=A0ABQ5D603_9ASTR
MADLKFVDQHNMVAYLEKSDENAEFHQIVDFLSTCSINYALTVSPTIYASYIEQFWNTATSKTVNSVKQIHAIVDGKAVVISESSVRSDLLFNDEDGVTCLTNDEIFENLALMGYEQLLTKLTFQKGNITPLFAYMLVQNQAPEGEGSTIHPKSQPTPSTSQPNVSEPQIASLHIETSLTAAPQTEAYQTVVSQIVFHEAHIEKIPPSPTTYQRKRMTKKCKRIKKDTELPQTSVPLDHGADEAVHKEGVTVWQSQAPRNHGGTPAQTRSERVLEQPNEPPLSEGHTSGRGYTPRSDEGRMKLDELITLCIKLLKHVLDLEKEKDAQAVEILNLKKRVKNLERKKKSSISHPRRKYIHIETSSDDGLDEDDASKQGRRSDKIKPMFTDKDFEELDDHMENVEEETVDAATTGVSTAAVTINVEDSSRTVRHVRSITTLQHLPNVDPKDKGKGVLVEEEPVKIKRRDQGDLQIQADVELAQRLLEEELAELERRQKERVAQEEASMAALYEEYDTIQASIDADALFTTKL